MPSRFFGRFESWTPLSRLVVAAVFLILTLSGCGGAGANREATEAELGVQWRALETAQGAGDDAARSLKLEIRGAAASETMIINRDPARPEGYEATYRTKQKMSPDSYAITVTFYSQENAGGKPLAQAAGRASVSGRARMIFNGGSGAGDTIAIRGGRVLFRYGPARIGQEGG